MIERQTKPRQRHVANSALQRSGSNQQPPTMIHRPTLARPSIDEIGMAVCHDHRLVNLSGLNCSFKVSDDKILASMKALGVATFSIISRSAELAAHARDYYVQAIRLLNTSLASSTEIIRDSTLLTSITLSDYECILGADTKAFAAYKSHIQGTAALIKLRGAKQLHTPQGRILFYKASICLLVECIRANKRVPEWIRSRINPRTTQLHR